MPEDQRDKLAAFGLLDTVRAAAGKELPVQVDEFMAALVAKARRRNTRVDREPREGRYRRVRFRGLFGHHAVESPATPGLLREPRTVGEKTRKGISFQPPILPAALKAFCKWMIRERRASEHR